MSIGHARLDRFIMQKLRCKRRDVKLMLAKGLITTDGNVCRSGDVIVNQFTKISVNGEIVQANNASYWMLNKPTGVVCATMDEQHQTVIDLLDCPERSALHIVGRLDLNTSGLVLLTNDSRWSAKLTQPQHKVTKYYHVTLQNPVNEDYIAAFAQGMYFPFEDLTTLPVKLTILSPFQAQVELTEGRYHQIKRMFGRFRNPVKALHRYQIGQLVLDPQLENGQSRALSPQEVISINSNS